MNVLPYLADSHAEDDLRAAIAYSAAHPTCNWCHADVRPGARRCSDCGHDPAGRVNPDLCEHGPCSECR